MDAFLNIVIAAVVFGVLFFGVGLKVLAKKDKEVQGSCASRNQFLNEGGCSICGKEDTQSTRLNDPCRQYSINKKHAELLEGPGRSKT